MRRKATIDESGFMVPADESQFDNINEKTVKDEEPPSQRKGSRSPKKASNSNVDEKRARRET